MEISKSKITQIFQAVYYFKVSWILLLTHQTGQKVPLWIKYTIGNTKGLSVKVVEMNYTNGFCLLEIDFGG